jgi:uncharacterized protein
MRISELERLLSKIPPEIEQLESEWKSIQERIANLQNRRVELDKLQLTQRHALEDAQAKAVKYEGDLHNVTNTKEYHAVLKEIDMAKKKISALEEDISNRTKEAVEIVRNIEECNSLEAESKNKYDAAMAKHKESQAENQQEHKEKTRMRNALADAVPERVMRQFERIAQRRNGIGLSMCVSAICQACNVRVRQNIVDELRKHDQIISCESCKRILFFSEIDE